jgi:uncharacterized RDD family membrane protein YckC
VYAPWGARFGALVIDGVLLNIVSHILRGALGHAPGATNASVFFPFWPAILVAALYFPLCHSLAGQTVGKAAVGLKVFDSASLGRLSLGRAFLRWFVTFLFWIPVIPGLLDGLSPLWNEDSNQAWHDKIGRSVVMNVRGPRRGAATVAPKPVQTERLWTSSHLKAGSISAFALGIVSVVATAFAGLVYAVGHGPADIITGGDSPAVSQEKLVIALSLGGATIALFALAVLLCVVQMRRSGLSLPLLRENLAFSAATAVAAVLLAVTPGPRHLGVFLGVVSVVSLVVCWMRIVRLPHRAWRAGA